MGKGSKRYLSMLIYKSCGAKMGRLLVTIDDDLERKFRVEVAKRFGGRRGDIKKAIEEAIRLWITSR